VTPQSKTNTSFDKNKDNNDPNTSTITVATDTTATAEENTNDVTRNFKAQGSIYGRNKIYHSPLLGKNFKISNESLQLNPELEPLCQLILSQHKVFAQPIQDLGFISITLTKIIEKKQHSLIQLERHDKIPRRLQLKCELTTLSAYTDNPHFLTLKLSYKIR
jgi:hypothetical protein